MELSCVLPDIPINISASSYLLRRKGHVLADALVAFQKWMESHVSTWPLLLDCLELMA